MKRAGAQAVRGTVSSLVGYRLPFPGPSQIGRGQEGQETAREASGSFAEKEPRGSGGRMKRAGAQAGEATLRGFVEYRLSSPGLSQLGRRQEGQGAARDEKTEKR